jgi:hypothetical protein
MFMRGVLISGVLILLAMSMVVLVGGTVATLFLMPDDAGIGGLWLTPLCGLGLATFIGLPLLMLLVGGLFGRHHVWKMTGWEEDKENHPFRAAKMWWHRQARRGAVPPWHHYREEAAGESEEPAKEEPR